MATTLDGSEQQIPINFDTPRSRVPAWGYDEEYFRIYSTRFSADGKEIIAGGSGLICGKCFHTRPIASPELIALSV